MFKIAAAVGVIGFGAYAAYTKYNTPHTQQTQNLMLTTNNLQDNLIELINATGDEYLIYKRDALINDLLSSDHDINAKATAWHEIINPLNFKYYMEFDKITLHIAALAATASVAIQELDGKLGDNTELASDVVQFIFKIANYYYIASTLNDVNFDECTYWLLKAKYFINNNSLKNSIHDATLHNLMGKHKSRAYQTGRDTNRPLETVMHFKEAVRIHKEELGSSLDNPHDIALRHVQICYSKAMLQDAVWCILHDGKISADVQQTIAEAKSLLEELTPERLVLKNSKPDLYSQANCLQAEGEALMLAGNFAEAIIKITSASTIMTNAIGDTDANENPDSIINLSIFNSYIDTAQIPVAKPRP